MKPIRTLLLPALFLFAAHKSVAQPISWNGAGDGSSWSDAQNWVGAQVPGPTNNVFITNGGGTVTISSAVTVESVLCSNALVISSGSLTVTNGNSFFGGALTVASGGTLTASGSGTTLMSGGAVDIDNGNLLATFGANLSLPKAFEYTHSDDSASRLVVSGAGSLLSLPGLTNITGINDGAYYPLTIEAVAGGKINMANVTLISNTIVQVTVATNAVEVDLSGLQAFYGYPNEGEGVSGLGQGGGELLLGKLGIVTGVNILWDAGNALDLSSVTNMAGSTLFVTNGVLSLPKVADIDNASLYVYAGATLSLPGVLGYTHTAPSNPNFWASGAGAVLSLPGLTNITGINAGNYYPLVIQTFSGAQIRLKGLASVANTIVEIESDGAGSEIDLSGLRSFYGYRNVGDGFSQLQATDGGTVLVGSLGTINSAAIFYDPASSLNLGSVTNIAVCTFTVTNGSVTLPNVTDIDDANLYVSDGATLSFPSVGQYTNTADEVTVFQSSGPGSVLTLAALTNVTGLNAGNYNPLRIQALAGGQVNLPGLVSSSSTVVQITAAGNGSKIDLSGLRTFSGYPNVGDGFSQFSATEGGTVLIGQLGSANGMSITEDPTGTLNLSSVTNLSGTTLIVTNGALSLPNVVNIDNANLYVSDGASLSMPAVRQYNHSAGAFTYFQSSGLGSMLSLTGLAEITGTNAGNYYPLAIQAVAGGVVNLSGVISSSDTIVQMEASGAGSEIDLSAMESFSGYQNVGDGFSQFTATAGGTVFIGQLGNVFGIDILEDGTGTLDLNAITNLGWSTLTVTNELLTLTNLAVIDNTSLYVNAGAALSLPAVLDYDHDLGSFAVFQASGPGSVLALTSLTNIMGTNAGNYYPLTIEAQAGGFVNMSGLITSSETVVQMQSSGTNSVIDLSALRTFYGYRDVGDGFSQFDASGGGTVLVGQLGTLNGADISEDANSSVTLTAATNLSGSTFILNSGNITLTNLANIDGASLVVGSGATLTLPNVRNYIDVGIGAAWAATNSGSVLALPGLTNFTGNSVVPTLVEAGGGGQVNLGNLQSIFNGFVNFNSSGVGSVIDLTNLFAFVLQNGQGQMEAQGGGAILLNSEPFLLSNVGINISGSPVSPGTLQFPASPDLTLGAMAWHSYRVEERNTLQAGSTIETLLVAVTNAFQTIAPVPPPNTVFQVVDFVANPPILQIGLTPDNDAQLVLFGLTNATYQVQSATNLSGRFTWTSDEAISMTNAFRILPESPFSSTLQLFRAEQQ